MADYIIISGDLAVFQPNFGKALVAVRPGRIQGSGGSGLLQKKICIKGDERSVSVPGCTYFTPEHAVPGMGVLKIKALAGDQIAKTTRSKNKAVILKGGKFEAVFEVQQAAKKLPNLGGDPDTTASYTGSGNFTTANAKYKAS